VHRGADRLSLLRDVAAVLRTRDIAFAIVGAGAMAVHGVTRGTRDLDILTLASESLESRTWTALPTPIEAHIQHGDDQDPLAGVVRFTVEGQQPVDLVVGKSGWQREVLARAQVSEIDGVRVPVATVSDLILLKLYAGGAQDAWDIGQLLEIAADRGALEIRVEAELAALPAECRQLWSRIHRG
jgi:predicted nucleotidyltransferase